MMLPRAGEGAAYTGLRAAGADYFEIPAALKVDHDDLHAIWCVAPSVFRYCFDRTPVSLDHGGEVMFVNIVHFPKIKEGKDPEFRQWFVDTNRAYAEHRGFIRRILLQPQDGGNYVGIVEHESRETFMAMHTSPTQAALRLQVEPLFEGSPRPAFYEVVID